MLREVRPDTRLVLALEVVLADGSLIRTGGRNAKDVAGYSLTHLIVGSQGTLGVVTEATLRLRPAPPPRLTCSPSSRCRCGRSGRHALAPAGLGPVTLELMDHETILAVDDAFRWSRSDRRGDAPHRVRPARRGRRIGARPGERDLHRAGATSVIRAADATEADWLRQARRQALHALERQGTVKMEDVVVPRARVPELIREIREISDRHGVRCATFGHAGDGNLHPNFIFAPDDPAGEAKLAAIQDDLYRAAIALGGSMTGEHGVGNARRAWMELQRGPDAIRAMRAIKDALDPLGS